jgi:biopolymer transport protein ExbD
MPRKKKLRRQSEVPVASMGDIAFLLIIFFLLLSEFNKDKPLPIASPTSADVEKNKEKPIARVAIDESGLIHVDGTAVSNAESVTDLLVNKLKDTLSDKQRHVQFKCDRAIGKSQFQPVLQAIAEAGGIIAAVGEKSE